MPTLRDIGFYCAYAILAFGLIGFSGLSVTASVSIVVVTILATEAVRASGDAAKHSQAKALPSRTIGEPSIVSYTPNEAEIGFVAKTLDQLEGLGFHRSANCSLTIEDYCKLVLDGYVDESNVDERLNNRILARAPYPTLSVIWIGFCEETMEDVQWFRNAKLIQDQCYDVVTPNEMLDLVNEVISLAGSDWKTKATLTTTDGDVIRMRLEDHDQEISMTHRKDLDFALFSMLNDVVKSKGLAYRFGALGDGGNILAVWLPLNAFPHARLSFMPTSQYHRTYRRTPPNKPLHRSRDRAASAVGNVFWLRLDEWWRYAS